MLKFVAILISAVIIVSCNSSTPKSSDSGGGEPNQVEVVIEEADDKGNLLETLQVEDGEAEKEGIRLNLDGIQSTVKIYENVAVVSLVVQNSTASSKSIELTGAIALIGTWEEAEIDLKEITLNPGDATWVNFEVPLSSEIDLEGKWDFGFIAKVPGIADAIVFYP